MDRSNVTSNSKVYHLSRRNTKLGRVGDGSEDSIGLETLYDPPDQAIADLVFVHGLMGGSRSTWTKSGDPTLFWPKEWLPKDAGFQDVRIHSFGYDSHWEKESPLSIYDFAKSLLDCLYGCTSMQKVCFFSVINPHAAKSSLLMRIQDSHYSGWPRYRRSSNQGFVHRSQKRRKDLLDS